MKMKKKVWYIWKEERITKRQAKIRGTRFSQNLLSSFYFEELIYTFFFSHLNYVGFENKTILVSVRVGVCGLSIDMDEK